MTDKIEDKQKIIMSNTKIIPHTKMLKKMEIAQGFVSNNTWMAKKNKTQIPNVEQLEKTSNFQKSLRLTLVIGQAFALIPVDGIFSKNAMNVRFVWSSWKCGYTFISILGQVYMTVMCIYKVRYSNKTLNAITPLIFYGTTCITTVMFFRIAKYWPKLCQHIARSEELDPNFDYKLTYRCRITCIMVLMLAALEHILSLLSAFAETMTCYANYTTYHGFVKHFYPWVFESLPFSYPLGVITQFVHFQSTFIWNFSDLFVMCMSYYLTSRLRQINKKLLEVKSKYLPESFWRTTREEYTRVTQLVRRVDNVISGIVFISFANNLFFICLQLFNTLEDGINGSTHCNGHVNRFRTTPLSGYEAGTYFFFSLIYLISRSIAVSLIASQVNSASTVPAMVLYDVPSPVYCVEVQRFLDQVTGDTIALSGLKFFKVTRGLLLVVAGQIVTYELVMVQFNTPSATTSNISSTVLPSITTTLNSQH